MQKAKRFVPGCVVTTHNLWVSSGVRCHHDLPIRHTHTYAHTYTYLCTNTGYTHAHTQAHMHAHTHAHALQMKGVIHYTHLRFRVCGTRTIIGKEPYYHRKRGLLLLAIRLPHRPLVPDEHLMLLRCPCAHSVCHASLQPSFAQAPSHVSLVLTQPQVQNLATPMERGAEHVPPACTRPHIWECTREFATHRISMQVRSMLNALFGAPIYRPSYALSVSSHT